MEFQELREMFSEEASNSDVGILHNETFSKGHQCNQPIWVHFQQKTYLFKTFRNQNL